MAKSSQAMENVPKATAMERPAFLKQGQSRGFEAMEQRDITVPRLAIAQSMTPARKRGNPKYNPDLQEGQLFNSVSGEVYGDFVVATPLFFFKSRIMFRDLDKGGGVMCMAPDGK